MGMQLDTDLMEKSLKDLTKGTLIDDSKLVTFNGKTVLKKIAFETPKSKGFARGGWTDAWSGLGIPGSPYTRKGPGKHKVGNKDYVVKGEFIDNRKSFGNASVEFVNDTHIIWHRKNSSVRVNYIYDLNFGDLKSLSGGASIGQDNKGFLQKAINRSAFEFIGLYEKRMDRLSSK